MSLSVIGAGFGRTGTMTLKLALEQLGLGKCHHMEEIFGDPSQLPRWLAATAGEKVDWDEIYHGYSCTADWPGAFFWHQLAGHYPDAKIIVTLRPAESWWESYSNTIMKFMQIVPDDAPPHIHQIVGMVKTLVGEKTFGTVYDDKQAALKAFNDHIEQVTQSIEADRLLCFSVKDGWEPLCNFLDKPIPSGAFPRSNSAEEFWENFPLDG